MKNVALHNLGCKVNSYELEVMQEKLENHGYKIVPFSSEADIYIVNTCTVTNIADRKSRQMLHKAKKMNPEAVVVAVGCYVQTGMDAVAKDECIDLAVGNNRKKDIVEILEAFLKEREADAEGTDKTLHGTTVLDINKGRPEYEEMTLTRAGEHTRAHIKIQDGCNQFCSYCIIPYARGRVRSRREEDILKEVKGLVAAGYREVVITGIHISGYGSDFTDKTAGDYMQGNELSLEVYKKGYLMALLEKMNAIEGLDRIRLGSLEPRIITEDFVRKLKSLEKVCPHFHLSLQSGCDATLQRMNRHYTAREYKEKVELLRRIYENPAITTDVIVGFPGETDEEFRASYEFVQKLRFYDLHVFKYSRRQGTPAAMRTDQVPDGVKEARSGLMITAAEQHSIDYRRGFLGKKEEALVEEEKEIDGQKYQIGFTPSYVKVAIKSEEDLRNTIIAGNVIGVLNSEYLLLK